MRAERPSPFVMTVSFAAQSLVAAIVALNLGLKAENFVIWKKFENIFNIYQTNYIPNDFSVGQKCVK